MTANLIDSNIAFNSNEKDLYHPSLKSKFHRKIVSSNRQMISKINLRVLSISSQKNHETIS